VFALSHLGICVTDLDRSIAFYVDGLGFSLAERHEIGAEFAALMELDEVELSSQFVRREHLAIELLCFTTPRSTIEPRRPITMAGLTHLSFRVDDLDSAQATLIELGGSVIEGTLTEMSFGPATLRFVYLTDPDGTRVELMEIPG
jgi:lactoylglutathione lyase